MRIALLVIDGEPERAQSVLRSRYQNAQITLLPRRLVETGTMLARLGALRKLSPDVFAVSTGRLSWQQGQNLLLLFGALAGAKRTLLLDSDGESREKLSSEIILSAPYRVLHEAWVSAKAITRARRQLKRLELALEARAQPTREGFHTAMLSDRQLHLTYVRSTTAPGTLMGGATTHINGFINAALELGAQVRLIGNDRIEGLEDSRLPQRILKPSPRGLTRAIFDLHNGLLFTKMACNEIVRDPPDVIYQRYSRFSWTGVAASLRTGRPLFLEYNGSEVWMGRHWDRSGMFELLERCEQLNLEAATRIFVVSDVERRNLERVGVAGKKIVVNPNGVDIRRFQPHIGGAELRKELGLTTDETLVGFVGTFGPWHGVNVLVEAIKLLAKEQKIRFLLVGTGPLRENVETLLREAGLAQRCIFTGAVPHERVPLLLDASDVLVSPHVPLNNETEFFGSPTKLFEYMAMGKSIVASRLGQIAEVLKDEKTALLVEPGDAEALAKALVRLAHSRELREQLGVEARRACIARHTWIRNAEMVLNTYRSL